MTIVCFDCVTATVLCMGNACRDVSSVSVYNYASVGGATRHTVVVVSVIRSVCRNDFSSLAENYALEQATRVEIDTCSDLNFQKFDFKA